MAKGEVEHILRLAARYKAEVERMHAEAVAAFHLAQKQREVVRAMQERLQRSRRIQLRSPLADTGIRQAAEQSGLPPDSTE